MSLTVISLPLTAEPEVDFDRELEWFRHEYMSTPDGEGTEEDDTDDDTDEPAQPIDIPTVAPDYQDFGGRFLGC